MNILRSFLAVLVLTVAAPGADIVRNLGGTSNNQARLLLNLGNTSGQAFVTGPTAVALGSITVTLRNNPLGPGDDGSARVKLWSGPSDVPVSVVEDLGVISGGVSVSDTN